MSCTDAKTDVNNQLHLADDEDAITVILEYGAYMN